MNRSGELLKETQNSVGLHLFAIVSGVAKCKRKFINFSFEYTDSYFRQHISNEFIHGFIKMN